MLAVIFVDELKVHELMVIPAPKLHVGAARKFVPVRITLRFVLPCAAVLGLKLVSDGLGLVATVMVRTGGLGSVFPAVSVTVKATV